MNEQPVYYRVKPKFSNVTKKEFVGYINNYPRQLERDVFGANDPPSVTYNDFELADRWPHSVVASTYLYDDTPGSYWYEPEEDRVYRIMVNYKEVFNSRIGNKTIYYWTCQDGTKIPQDKLTDIHICHIVCEYGKDWLNENGYSVIVDRFNSLNKQFDFFKELKEGLE